MLKQIPSSYSKKYFLVPGLPDPKHRNQNASVPKSSLHSRRVLADVEPYGVIANAFEKLEPEYVKEYKKVREGKVWCVGPDSLTNKPYL